MTPEARHIQSTNGLSYLFCSSLMGKKKIESPVQRCTVSEHPNATHAARCQAVSNPRNKLHFDLILFEITSHQLILQFCYWGLYTSSSKEIDTSGKKVKTLNIYLTVYGKTSLDN